MAEVENTSNMDEPGKWIFRIDNALESAQCDNTKSFQGKRLQIKPAFVRLFGHIPITLRGPCLTSVAKVSCRFMDPKNRNSNDVLAVFDAAYSSVTCQVPYLYTYGRIQVDMVVVFRDNSHVTYSGYLYVRENEDEVHVSSSVGPTQEQELSLSLSWNPSYFQNTRDKRSKRESESKPELELVLLQYSNNNSWVEKGVLATGLPNYGKFKGKVKINIPAGEDSGIFVYSIKEVPEEFQEEIHPVKFSDIIFLKQAFTPFTCAHNILPLLDNAGGCQEWYRQDQGPPTDILPCPPLLTQAAEDDRFEFEGHEALLRVFHPGALTSYRQRSPSPSGAGQQCVYGEDGRILVGPPSGGTADSMSPNKNKFEHWTRDVVPWCMCCAHSNDPASCGKYYERRTSDPGNAYIPPSMVRAAGDPHIMTFDSTAYTFNGVGEFWMIRTEDRRFSMQARMEQFRTPAGLLTKASIFTAFVMKEKDESGVQVFIRPFGIGLSVDGELINFLDSGLRRLNLDGVSIHAKSSSKLSLSFPSGLSFVFTTPDNVSLNIMGSASQGLSGSLQGLLGFFDNEPENDLMSPDGITIPANSSFEHIHFNFGLRWMTAMEDSLFQYPEGKDHGSYANPAFVPTFASPNPASLSLHVLSACGNSLDCLYDYSVTGSMSMAVGSREIVLGFEKAVETGAEMVQMCESDLVLGLKNGYFTASNFFISSNVNFFCYEGYDLVGHESLTCAEGESGHAWNGEMPVCSGSVKISAELKLYFMFFVALCMCS
jgi:hypothetical protein